MTIADKMRQMTDEELARILEIVDNTYVICNAAGHTLGNCIYDGETHPTCEGCLGYLKWLQQEVVE